MCIIRFLVKLLVAIGALAWGIIGFFNYNLMTDVLGRNEYGEYSGLARTVFALVGIAGVIFVIRWCMSCCCKPCGTCACSKGSCGPCNCSPHCTRCSCNRHKHE